MLGVRLDSDTERQLDALARRTRRTKSDIAREAVRGYVRRHAADDGAAAQWREISAREKTGGEIDTLLREAAEDLCRNN